jgi:hypothetical protein
MDVSTDAVPQHSTPESPPQKVSRGELELLPDGRPKAVRRQKKASRPQKDNAGPLEAEPQAKATEDVSRPPFAKFIVAWLTWHAKFDRVWRMVAAKTDSGELPPLCPPAVSAYAMDGQVLFKPSDMPNAAAVQKRFGKQQEFLIGGSYSAALIDHAVSHGVFPMTVPVHPSFQPPRVPALKLHVERCVAFVGSEAERRGDTALPPLQTVGGVSAKLAKRLLVVVNSHWDDVCKLIRDQHGPEWLDDSLRTVFRYMLLNRDKYQHAKLQVIAIIDPSQPGAGGCPGMVVAGELGFLVGTTYTSLTGAYTMDGAGTVQLAVLQALLHLSGVTVWDLGMAMGYKKRVLGAGMIPRRQWMQLVAAAASKKITPRYDPALSGGEAFGPSPALPLLAITGAAWKDDASVRDAVEATHSLGRLTPVPTPCHFVLNAFRAHLNAQNPATTTTTAAAAATSTTTTTAPTRSKPHANTAARPT